MCYVESSYLLNTALNLHLIQDFSVLQSIQYMQHSFHNTRSFENENETCYETHSDELVSVKMIIIIQVSLE